MISVLFGKIPVCGGVGNDLMKSNHQREMFLRLAILYPRHSIQNYYMLVRFVFITRQYINNQRGFEFLTISISGLLFGCEK